MVKLSSLIANKGTLILMTAYYEKTAGEQFSYFVDSKGFQSMTLTLNIILDVLKSAGFNICQVVSMGKGTAKGNIADFVLTCAEKKQLTFNCYGEICYCTTELI